MRALAFVILGIAVGLFAATAWALTYAHNPGSAYFPDVPSDSPHNHHIGYAVEYGVVQGYLDGTYQPEALVSRDQMATFVMRNTLLDSVLTVVLVDWCFFDGYYLGYKAYTEGRITQAEYEGAKYVVDLWTSLAQYETSGASTTDTTGVSARQPGLEAAAAALLARMASSIEQRHGVASEESGR